ncbi:MAG: hypothetical protein K5766_03930 [Alphaproteobacteria bacterium]|nr:hypothetical protein [Alphaproteobacteria bacterium]
MRNMGKKRELKRLFPIFTGIMLFTNVVYADFDSQRYYLGTTYLVKSDSDLQRIQNEDIHYGWDLGKFFINGYTKVIADPNKPIVFLKNTGDKIALWFQLKQNINCLNNEESISIDNGGIIKRNKGQGTLSINYIDHQNLSHLTLHQDYLKALSVGADTNVNFFEEGDYEISLDYTIRRAWINMESLLFWDVDIHTLPSHRNYRINFKFSVRNGNCMIFLRDVKTQEELTTYAPNGFYLDLTKSRYLDINVKKEVLEDNSDKLDVRFNKPAKDGDQYTEKGVYTITLKNRYTKEVTTKVISVGDDPILNAYASTLMQIGKIKKQLQNAKNSKNQINISLKDASNNIKLKVKVKPYKSDLNPALKSDKGEQRNESKLLIINQESISNTKDVSNNADLPQKNDNSESSEKLASIQKEVGECLSKELGEKDYKIEKVEAIYLSQEYIEELQYNSLANEYFGHSLKDIEKQFGEEKYVFTLDKDNKTIVRSLKNLDEDIWGKVIKDVAIGSGVILVSATVAVASGGTIGVIFVAAAKTGIYTAFSSALCCSVIAGTITGIQTKNFDKTVKSIVVAGAEGFKWGAIAGAVAGGATKALELKKASVAASAMMKGKKSLAIPAAATRGKESVDYAQKIFGGKKEISFLNEVEVPYSTSGSTRIDLASYTQNNQLIAREVKNYTGDYTLPKIFNDLKQSLIPAIKKRLEHLPKNSIQELILDIRGKNYSETVLEQLRANIQNMVKDIYPDMPVIFMK